MPITHLILIACHAVYLGRTQDETLLDQSWCLQTFQFGEPVFYIEHIEAGISLAAQNPDSLLIFAGGQTRREAGPLSEAQSYWLLAEQSGWWERTEVRDRATTEEFSRDSFENLLFGICRFREYTGKYPHRISVVSWKFKQERFDLHRQAIRFPADRFEFIGVNNPPDLESALIGEHQNSLIPFSQDPFGTGPVLAAKRHHRNPFHRQHGYTTSCPEVALLLNDAGPDPFPDKLPWEKHNGHAT